MPYNYLSYPRRRYRGNRGRLNRDLSTASKALAVAMGVKKLINVEWKSKTTVASTPAAATVSIQNLTAIAVGDDYDDREGRKIRLKSVQLKGSAEINASATATKLRVMVVRDNNGSTTAPVIADLFANDAAFYDNKPHNDDPQTNARFSVLMDKFYILDTAKQRMVGIRGYRKLNSHCYFSGSASTDEGKGSLWLLSASDEATNTPGLTMEAIVKWIDN